MYKNFSHGVMFHYFHNEKIKKKIEGSLTAKQFEKILIKIGIKNIVSPEIFLKKIKNKDYKKKLVCLTFDDGIKSQIKIALPLLNKYKLKAFFFCNNIPSKLDAEYFRYFRNHYYKKVDFFYKGFFNNSKKDLKIFFKNYKKRIYEIKRNNKYYSINDIKFRLVRDELLSNHEYRKIMLNLFKKKNLNYKKFKLEKELYFSKKDILKLRDLGHTVGLHTKDHLIIHNLSKIEQSAQYKKNLRNLSAILNQKKRIVSMSHPKGNFNKDTLDILNKIKIEIGFLNRFHDRKLLKKKYKKYTNLIIPRIECNAYLK